MKTLSSVSMICGFIFLLSAAHPCQTRTPADPSQANTLPVPRPNRGLSPVRPVVAADAGSEDLDSPSSGRSQPAAVLRKEVREKLRISDEEKASYKKFFSDSKANVIRILSAFSCSTALVVDLNDPRCLEKPDFAEASYYSFRYKNYGESPWTDMNLSESELTAGNKYNTLGMVVDLGDAVDLTKLDENSREVKSAWEIPGPDTLKEKNEQKAKLEKGFVYEEIFVCSKAKIQVNHTYLLRTTSYRVQGDVSAFRSAFNWYNTDSIFVFKVAAVDNDGTITIAWKKLKQRVAPMLSDRDRDKDKDQDQ